MPGQHKQRQCVTCKRWMRSDKLKGHMKTHKDLLDLPKDELEEELRARHDIQQEHEAKRQRVVETAKSIGVPVPVEIEDLESMDKDNLRELLLKDNQRYLKQIELGKNISSILDEGVIREDSLAHDKKLALDIYRRQRPRCDISSVQLRPWQKDAFDLFEQISDDRTVHWICDKEGNSGKSWFQNYVQAYFGYNRVFQCDLRMGHRDICHIMRKRSISTIDIFLFNDSRSASGSEVNLYRILDNIKDGQAMASKYDGNTISFKTPNIVMAFSTVYPNLNKLSGDRWRIYDVNRDKLIEF